MVYLGLPIKMVIFHGYAEALCWSILEMTYADLPAIWVCPKITYRPGIIKHGPEVNEHEHMWKSWK